VGKWKRPPWSGPSKSSAYGAEFAGSVFEKYATAIAVMLAKTFFASVSFQLDLFMGFTSLAERWTCLRFAFCSTDECFRRSFWRLARVASDATILLALSSRTPWLDATWGAPTDSVWLTETTGPVSRRAGYCNAVWPR
jgi:hypothetical protein